MKRTSQWLAVSAAACLTACYASGVVAGGQLPAENSGAQLPAENSRAGSPSGLTLTCEVFCSQTRLRTGNARIRWTLPPSALAASGITNLANSKQALELSVFSEGFEKGLFATLPISIPTPERPIGALARPIGTLAQGKPPALRAYQVRLIEIERPPGRAPADVAGEMSVVIEDLEPGVNYSWRVVIEAPSGRLVSAPVTCQATTCPADMIRRRP